MLLSKMWGYYDGWVPRWGSQWFAGVECWCEWSCPRGFFGPSDATSPFLYISCCSEEWSSL